MLKFEIAKMTDGDGLTDFKGVDRLEKLMYCVKVRVVVVRK